MTTDGFNVKNTITQITVNQDAPREVWLKMAPKHDGTPIEWNPYPGWRFVPTADGGMRHEKIPSVWQRIKAFFVGEPI